MLSKSVLVKNEDGVKKIQIKTTCLMFSNLKEIGLKQQGIDSFSFEVERTIRVSQQGRRMRKFSFVVYLMSIFY
jgi:hypothetical protein